MSDTATTPHDEWVKDALGVDPAQYAGASPLGTATAPAGAPAPALVPSATASPASVSVFSPLDSPGGLQDALKKAAADVVAAGNEADDWLRNYLRGNSLGRNILDDSGATVMFDNKTTPLDVVVNTTLSAGRLANLAHGGNDLITRDRVQRIITELLLATIPRPPNAQPGKPLPQNVSMYIQYTFTPTTVHTPLAGGKDSADQPAHSIAGQITFEFHGENESGLEISAIGQATWFADDKGGHVTNQSGFTGAQAAWVWTFLDGNLQAGPLVQALVGASKAQQNASDKLVWTPTGQIGAGGQVQYAIPGFNGHVLVGAQAGVSATDAQGAPATGDKTFGLTFTVKF